MPQAKPLPRPTAASFSSALREFAQVSSPSAMPRTITVSVCVAALPPMPATTGMNTASTGTILDRPSNSATTDAARKAVTRFTSSHGTRLRSDSTARREHAVVAGDAGQAVDVLGRLVLDDVDDVVDGDDADELVLFVDDRDREQVVRRDQPRDFFLVGVGPHAGQIGRHDPLQRRRRRHEQEPAQRHDADEVAARVDDVEVEDHLDVARSLERRDRLRPPSCPPKARRLSGS